MNNIIKYAAFASGGVVLFFSSFLAFSALSGTPPHELAVIGGLFPAPVEEEVAPESAPIDLADEIERDDRPVTEVIEAAASPLRAFLLASPFSTDELDQLQRQVKRSHSDALARAGELDERERELEARERQLDERWEELVQIRTTLIEHDLELQQREDELTRDERNQAEQERASWASMAKIFENGDAAELIDNLQLFGPENAAQVLRGLSEERASELINLIPRDRYLEFAEAYRRSGN